MKFLFMLLAPFLRAIDMFARPTVAHAAVIEGSIARGAGVENGSGVAFYVDSVNGSSSYGGGSWGQAKATIAQALALCTANRGDIIYVAAGHAETIAAAAGIDFSVAGVYVKGFGRGTKRPTLSSATSTAATVVISAANVVIENILGICGVDSQVIFWDCNSTDTTFIDCEVRNATAAQVLTAWDINGGGANACDRVRLINCRARMSAVGSNSAVELGEVADGVEIRGCIFWGDFSDACIHNPTGKVLTNLTIADCELTNLQTGDHSIELVSACTGNLIRNMYHNDMTQATGSDPGSCFSYQCFHDDVIDTSAILSPAVT